MFSQTASQSPAHSGIFDAIDFKTTLSPCKSASVASNSSVSGLYIIKSTKACSVSGSSVHSLRTSEICTTLFFFSNPEVDFIGFATTIISVALKEVFGTPKSLTTRS